MGLFTPSGESALRIFNFNGEIWQFFESPDTEEIESLPTDTIKIAEKSLNDAQLCGASQQRVETTDGVCIAAVSYQNIC